MCNGCFNVLLNFTLGISIGSERSQYGESLDLSQLYPQGHHIILAKTRSTALKNYIFPIVH